MYILLIYFLILLRNSLVHDATLNIYLSIVAIIWVVSSIS